MSKSKNIWFHIRETRQYKDLIYILIKKQMSTTYSQTIFGLTWHFITPFLTALVYTIILGNFASIPTDGIPKIIFFLSGVIIWDFFNNTINSVSTVLQEYKDIMCKVYIPRLIPPLAILGTNFIKFLVQFLVFLIFYAFFYFSGTVAPNLYILIFPFVILLIGILGFGGGLLIAATTVKYRDLIPAVSFFMKILMFLTPVIYPLSLIPEKHKIYAQLNPLVSCLEASRIGWFGLQPLNAMNLLYSIIFMFLLLTLSIYLYLKNARSFIDTI